MKHFIYKTTDKQSGKYYIGRHSTLNINDGYLGSGKWVRSLKDKTNLNREILLEVDSFDELLKAEETLLSEVLSDPLNMNFNNRSVGFPAGDLNIAKTEKERKRKRENNWLQSKEGRRWLSENNPSKKASVKVKRRKKAYEQFSLGTHNFQKEETRLKRIEKAKERFKTSNPMHNLNVRQKMSTIMKNKPTIKVLCPHCAKTIDQLNAKRWHLDNCKRKAENLENYKYITN